MINPITSCYSYQRSNPSFKMKKFATFGNPKGLSVYKLEEKDIGYLKHLVKNLERFFIKYDVDNKSARQVIEEAFNAAIAILKAKNPPEEKADILMAYYKKQPSAMLIGNVMKIDKNGHIHYSSAYDHPDDVTELDWLVTWNKKIPGEGQDTVYGYYRNLADENYFNKLFVRSEVPENSSAVNFYTRMGFNKIGRRRPILRKDDNRYVIGKFDDKADKIIPMMITLDEIKQILKEKADIVKLKLIKSPRSVTMPYEKFD